MAQGSEGKGTVSLRNNTGRTVHLLSAVAGCGCTTVNPPQSIPPGQSRPVEVRFDSTGYIGTVDKGINVTFAEYPKRPLSISIYGKIHQEIVCNPTQIDLGDVNTGEVKSFSFTCRRTDGRALKLSEINKTKNVRLRVQPSADRVSVSGVLSAPLSPDYHSDDLTFATDDLALPVISQKLVYNILPRFKVTPVIANFGEAAAGKELQITIYGGNAIIAIDYVPSAIEAKLSPVSAGRYRLTLRFLGGGARGILNERLTLRTNDPKQPQINIPVYAITEMKR